jgi:hypothetical protein
MTIIKAAITAISGHGLARQFVIIRGGPGRPPPEPRYAHFGSYAGVFTFVEHSMDSSLF